MSKLPIIMRFGLIPLLAIQTVASAHAYLDHADPRVGATISKAPSKLSLWFTQDLQPGFAKVQVLNSEGKEVDKKDAHVDPKDRSLLIISLPQLPPGTYRVSWRVVSVDTHRNRGDFKFVVKGKE